MVCVMEFVFSKDYFVITSNVEGPLRKAGVEESMFFQVQGNYGYYHMTGKLCKIHLRN
jgi:hypothetical protein